MGKVLPVLAIVGSVMAALAATVLQNLALLLVAAFVVASAVVMFVSRDRNAVIAGVLLVVLAVVGALGTLGSISTEDGETDFGVPAQTGTALLVLASLGVTAAVLVTHWASYSPTWLGFALAAVLVLAAIDTLSIQDALGDQSRGAPFGVVVLSLLSLPVGILPLRND